MYMENLNQGDDDSAIEPGWFIYEPSSLEGNPRKLEYKEW